MGETTQNHRISRRGMFHAGSAALAGVAAQTVANAQDTKKLSGEISANRSPDHRLKNETVHGPRNPPLAEENPNSTWPPETDNGTVPPFKYSFALAHKRIDTGAWTRQVTAPQLQLANKLA